MSDSQPIAYSIERNGLTLDIALVESDKLLLHEEIIPDSLAELKNRIINDKVLRAPIIADKDTLVILDGMHRVTALRDLGCRFICVCLIDYMNPEIKLDRWCRAIDRATTFTDVSDILAEKGITLERAPQGQSLDEIILHLPEGKYAVSTSKKNIKNMLNTVVTIELFLESKGYTVTHEIEEDAKQMMKRGAVGAFFCPPLLEKRQVIEVATRGEVFAFKSTRHVIPARPVGVNVPLKFLKNDKLDVFEANCILSESLEGKRLRRIQPGGYYGTRRYEEELYVFE
ncbi:MAG: ParB N-terminal domain-containing protein [Candidatus Bathyarchaeia archaeon]